MFSSILNHIFPQSSPLSIYLIFLNIVSISILIVIFISKLNDISSQFDSINQLFTKSTNYINRVNANNFYIDKTKILFRIINHTFEGKWRVDKGTRSLLHKNEGTAKIIFRFKKIKRRPKNVNYLIDLYLLDGKYNDHFIYISNLFLFSTTDQYPPFIYSTDNADQFTVSYENILITSNEYSNMKNINNTNRYFANITFKYDQNTNNIEGFLEYDDTVYNLYLKATKETFTNILIHFFNLPLIIGIWNLIFYSCVLDYLTSKEYEAIRVFF